MVLKHFEGIPVGQQQLFTLNAQGEPVPVGPDNPILTKLMGSNVAYNGVSDTLKMQIYNDYIRTKKKNNIITLPLTGIGTIAPNTEVVLNTFDWHTLDCQEVYYAITIAETAATMGVTWQGGSDINWVRDYITQNYKDTISANDGSGVIGSVVDGRSKISNNRLSITTIKLTPGGRYQRLLLKNTHATNPISIYTALRIEV